MYTQIYLVTFLMMQNVVTTISRDGKSTKIASKRDRTYSGRPERLGGTPH